MDTRDLARFWPKVEIQESGCWLWTAGQNGRGYGYFSMPSIRRSPYLAHRASYEHFVGPIPAGLQIDHLCRVSLCVNPAHLEVVTNRENTLRGRAGEQWSQRTHCSKGHPYDEQNTIHRSDGGRRCRACHCAYHKKKWDERKRRRWLTHPPKGQAGENNNASRLSEVQVREIKQRLGIEKGVTLASEFGVSTATISLIKNGRLWPHIQQ